MTFGGFRLDPATEGVWLDGEEIRLRPKAFAVLRYLADRPRRLVTKEELLAAVWPDVAVGEAALAVCVGEIRKALRDEARTPRFVETVHRRGYRFIGTMPVEIPSPDTPLIGRETELARLRHAVGEAWQGRGRVVVIGGEGGIGKSRVVEELSADAVRRGGRVLVGRCYETEQILPFGPWVNAMRKGHVLSEIAGAGALPAAWQSELTRLFPELGALPPVVDSAQNLRLFEAMSHGVERLTRTQPLLLVLEDVHWADEMSLRLVAFVARKIPSWSVLMVVTAREEDVPGAPVLGGVLQELIRDDRTVRLTLPPLSRLETAHLVRAMARGSGDDAALERLADQLWAVSEGNPFLAIETMRAIQDGTAPPSGVPLPERVRDVLLARLSRLSERGRQLAAVASVIGREFDFAVLARAVGLDEGWAAEGVEELVRRRVLTGAGERFDFTHDRIREVAYGQLLPPRRRLLHVQVAGALEEVYRDALEPHHAALAEHYRRGELWEKALSSLRKAGNRAVACSANREAIAYYEQALQVLEHLPEGRTKTARAYDLWMNRAAVYYSLGELRRIVDRLDEAEALARALDDPTRLGRLAVLQSACLAPMGDHAAAIESGARGLASAEADGNRPRQAVAAVMLGFACMGLGDLRRAVELLRTSGDLLQDEPVHERFGHIGLPAVFWRTWMILSLGELGAFPEAMTCGHDAVRLADAADQPFSMAEAHGALGHLHALKGELSAGIPELERSVALCRDYELVLLSPAMFSALGHAYALSGRLADAVAVMEEAVARGASLEVMWWQSRRVTNLAEGYLLADRVRDAKETADRALALAEAHGERGSRAHALRVLGEIAGHREAPDYERARQHLSEALALAEELGMQPLVARCHRGLGTLYRSWGKRERAATHLDTATRMFRTLDMRV